MATRFYLQSEAAPYLPAAWRGGWDLDGTISRAFDPIKFGVTVGTASRTETSATTPYRLGVVRLVSRRLAPQTISGTVNLIVGVNESSVNADFFTRLHLFVERTDGTLLGTLLNQYEESSGGGGTEWPTTNTGRALQAAQTLTNVTVPNDGNDYRLVAELGARAENAVTTSYTAAVGYGARNGATGAPLADLTAGSTDTTTLAGFIEFSGTITIDSGYPTNLTAETATVIPASLPYDVTQNVRYGGYNYAVWFKRTTTADDQPMLGAFAWGGTVGSGYYPTIVVYAGEPGSWTQLVNGTQVPVQFANLTVGQSIYFTAGPGDTSASPASLEFSLVAAPTETAPARSILVNDDASPLPAVIVSATTGDVLRTVDLAQGEAGDLLLDSGISLWADRDANNLKRYDSDFVLLQEIAYDITDSAAIRGQQTLERFYVGKPSSPAEVKIYAADGSLVSTHTLTGSNDIEGIAGNNAGTIIYHARGTNTPIKRWDMVGNTALADLAAAPGANIQYGFNILILPDNSIIITRTSQTTGAFTVERWSDGGPGTLLNTYVIAASSFVGGSTQPRLAYDPAGDSLSFWVWFKMTGGSAGTSRFQRIRVSDGTVLESVDATEFEVGVSQKAETASPADRFGVSQSCAFIVMAFELVGSPSGSPGSPGSPSPGAALGIIGPLVWVHFPRQIQEGGGGSPSGSGSGSP